MLQHGLGGQRWLGQFALGFPITGSLSQSLTFETDETVLQPLRRAQLYDTASARFREQAAKSGRKNAQLLWGEPLSQAKKGWLLPFSPGPGWPSFRLEVLPLQHLLSVWRGSGQQAPRL